MHTRPSSYMLTHNFGAKGENGGHGREIFGTEGSESSNMQPAEPWGSEHFSGAQLAL